jgi:mono/diheme cytochrome c family protein
MKSLLLIVLLVLVAVPAVWLTPQFMDEEVSAPAAVAAADPAQQVQRGLYLAQAGNCIACHTTRGGEPYAGGRGIVTPFGTIYASNVTPDQETGIGSWTADDFWRALHHGKSKDGSFLYPAFPYPNYTKVTRADSDAMYAYFRTIEPVKQENREHALRFPYNQRALLAVWRGLYFTPGTYQPESDQSMAWNRGAYLVQGLGHCNACHADRNALGGIEAGADLAGAVIPVLDWYAPPLTAGSEAQVNALSAEQLALLLKTGVSDHSAVYGPMAEVVRHSLQYLTQDDVAAMATYLQSLPQQEAVSAPSSVPAREGEVEQLLRMGATIYKDQCMACHKEDGGGVPRVYPALAGNQSVTRDVAINPIRMVLHGGYPPSTEGNPRPYGMPPFSSFLSDEEVAAVVSYIRNEWGNKASVISPLEVERYRTVPID